MDELEFSLISYFGVESQLSALLKEFEAQHRVRVQVRVVNWEAGWAEIMKYALYGHGPAISEIGSTWVASLAAMNVLRPFATNEVAALGGVNAFLPAIWQSGTVPGDPTVWAIPWLAETRVLYYRRDLLRAAGIENATTFTSHEHLTHTLDRLKANVPEAPWTVPTQITLNTFHQVTSWIWGAGGDFLDVRGRQVKFHQPEARAGIRDYYSLHPYLPAQSLDAGQAEIAFVDGQAAVTMSGPWLWSTISSQLLTKPAVEVGVALPPGVPFVSGSHLVIWRHTPLRQLRLALELVRFLTSRNVQTRCAQDVGLLPVNVEALSAAPFADSARYQVMSQGLKTGRSFPALRLWGLIEDKLSASLGHLWSQVLATPDADLDALIQAELEPLAHRLNMTLRDN
jgi:multiple sugar transport system substrate-binding protein